MRVENLDVDIVVEGDGIQFAESLRKGPLPHSDSPQVRNGHHPVPGRFEDRWPPPGWRSTTPPPLFLPWRGAPSRWISPSRLHD
jgi:hypothetical protein